MRETLHQPPPVKPRPRWTLALMGRLIPAMRGLSLSGIWRRLQAAGIVYKRGRQHLHSPDPQYAAKRRAIARRLAQARHSGRRVLLYGDEKTFYRQPISGRAYGPRGGGGRDQPRAPRSYRGNTKQRLIAVLNAVSGRVTFAAAGKMGLGNLLAFVRRVRTAYPTQRISLCWDNWPVHAHPQLLAALAAHRIEVLPLPTYAPWTNPTEKLWNWLGEEVLVMHHMADRWSELKQNVHDFLARFAGPSPQLLRYTGLSPPY